ncbi:MAG: glucose 1-dehydrogenase [bacterium]
MFNLTGKVALVTGASSGLGVQYAKALAAQGADLVLLARRADKLEVVKNEIIAMGRKAMAIKCDVSNEGEIITAVASAVAEFKHIDILVNNAGVSAIAPAQDMTKEDWDKVIAVNLTGVFLVGKHVGKVMIAQNYGKIINISSMFGVVGNSSFPVANYHASKHGVVGLTKDQAAEWAKYNITVNAIGPGFFESEMTASAISTPDFQQYVSAFCPMKRIGKPGELNGALIYLASDESSYMTGQILVVDGGWTVV